MTIFFNKYFVLDRKLKPPRFDNDVKGKDRGKPPRDLPRRGSP
jgi:hypothetical protein